MTGESVSRPSRLPWIFAALGILFLLLVILRLLLTFLIASERDAIETMPEPIAGLLLQIPLSTPSSGADFNQQTRRMRDDFRKAGIGPGMDPHKLRAKEPAIREMIAGFKQSLISEPLRMCSGCRWDEERAGILSLALALENQWDAEDGKPSTQAENLVFLAKFRGTTMKLRPWQIHLEAEDVFWNSLRTELPVALRNAPDTFPVEELTASLDSSPLFLIHAGAPLSNHHEIALSIDREITERMEGKLKYSFPLLSQSPLEIILPKVLRFAVRPTGYTDYRLYQHLKAERTALRIATGLETLTPVELISLSRKYENQTTGRNLRELPAPDYGAHVLHQFVSSGLVRMALDLERIRRSSGSYPETYVPAARDPYAGAPLRYRKTPEGYLLNSVGPNGTNEGGQGDDISLSLH